jgi:glucose-6-phosphate isomerase/transaldolase/glucose-6-phosphate isomerase
MATAVAGHRLEINPFDQPNVEAAKVLAGDLVQAYATEGRLPEQSPTLVDGNLELYGATSDEKLDSALAAFLSGAQPNSYIVLQAYLQPTRKTSEKLHAIRTALRERTLLAITSGFGPRYLHSTGQLHKGDAGAGSFIQITTDDARDVDIPDEAGSVESSMSFGTLKAAQAMGEKKALEEAGRRVLRIHIKGDVHKGLARILRAMN